MALTALYQPLADALNRKHDTLNTHSFLSLAGVYNDVALAALDQLLADAADRGLRLVLILARNWGGPDSRASVSRTAAAMA